MDNSGYIAALDVGTKKICSLIAGVTSEEDLEIIGVGLSPSNGLRKGIVVDIEEASHSIRSALLGAEKMAGVEIDSAFVGIAGSHINSRNSHGVVAVTGQEREINRQDIDRVMEAAREITLGQGKEVIHVLPREFIVDGTGGIKHPQGMSGMRLEVETHIVTGATTSVENLVKSVRRAGVEVEDLVLDQLASSEAVLTDDEKELGVALVDIGGGTTDFIVFHEGNIAYTSVLPVGGDHVSNDIAVGLKTPISEAERAKIKFGAASTDSVEQNDKIEVMSASGRKKKKISRKYLCRVIQPRMEELFTLIRKEMESSGPREQVPAGLVLTGGASMLEGSCELAADVVDIPVRRGEPDYIDSLSEIVENPVYTRREGQIPKAVYSTSVGLLLYALNYTSAGKRRVKSRERSRSEIVNGFFQRIKSFFDDFF